MLTGRSRLSVALLMGGLLLLSGCASKPGSQDSGVTEQQALVVESTLLDSEILPVGDSPILGNINAAVTIVDFSSLQCPFCARGNETLKRIVEKYPDEVRIVSKSFPLEFQPQSLPAAKAALAAGEQGKYWEMRDLLLANMQRFRSSDMAVLTAEFAGQLDLDVDKFVQDFQNPEYDAKILKDQELGASLGVKGTPNYFINGLRVSGAQPFQAFDAVINHILLQAEEMVEGGVSRDALYREMVKAYYEPPVEEAVVPSEDSMMGVYMIPVRPMDPIKGDSQDFLVTVMEFSSFQCSFCARGADTMRKLAAKYPKNVRFVYKHFPLEFQAQSEPAARAAVAAGEQGKFWEMYDLLYKNQKNFENVGIFDELAGKIGLDMGKFKQDMESSQVAERVKESQADGRSAGVSGTPAFFINGVKLVGAKPAAEFVAEIDRQLEIAAKIKKEKNLKDDALYAAVVEHNKANAPKAPVAPTNPGSPAPWVDPSDLQIGTSYTRGPEDAPITIFEFSSFQCPFCARGATVLHEVMEAYPGKVRLVYKGFPLPFQAEAEPATRAAFAAGRQGKFWEYYDLIYKGQRKLENDGIFITWAKELGLNVEKFEKDISDPEIAEQVESEQAEGRKIGVQGTPAFFINGTRVVGAQPFERFKEIIDAELEKE